MKTWEEKRTKELIKTALLLAITLVIQSLRMPPPFTGPLINFMLLLTTMMLGVKNGITIGLLTPMGALLLGIIPPVLAPAIPFILLGNSCYLLLFFLLYHYFRGILGLVLGSLMKFAIIAGSANLLLDLPPGPATALGLPQLFTALLGGAGALILKETILPRVMQKRAGG